MQEKDFIYNYDNILDTSIGLDNGISLTQINLMNNEINQAFDTVVTNANVNTKAYFDILSQLPWDKMSTLANQVREFANDFVILGIGGSALGCSTIFQALCHLQHNILSKEQRQAPRFYVENNVDPNRLQALLDVIDLPKTVFCVISKSGNTVETLSQYYLMRDKIKTVNKDNWQKQFIFLTDDNNGLLNSIAKEENINVIHIPAPLGGRYSVLSAVGIFPALVLGKDAVAIVEGAKEMLQNGMQGNFWGNAPLLSAVFSYLNYQQGKKMSVIIPYSEFLVNFGEWFCQIWAESLGRKTDINNEPYVLGPTPIQVWGTSAQHSQFQLYIDGPIDKVFTFIEVEQSKKNFPLSKEFPKVLQTDNEINKSFHDLLNIEMHASRQVLALNQRPNELIKIKEINEKTLGKLFMFYMLKTSFFGALCNINPYGQPAVEEIKVLAKLACQETKEIKLEHNIQI